MAYRLIFPDYFDDREAEIEAKGYLVGLGVIADGRRFELRVYDEYRLAEDARDEVRIYGYFAVGHLLVVPKVTREEISRAVAKLAAGGFQELSSVEQ